MQINSLGYRTDLFFPKFEGLLLDRGDYLVILTPTNPGYYWGNYLLFPNPPAEGDFKRWQELFTREISSRQETHHMVFGWDTTHGETGAVEPFLDAGFRLSQSKPARYDRRRALFRRQDLRDSRFPTRRTTGWPETVGKGGGLSYAKYL
jgi:hypothetical protein